MTRAVTAEEEAAALVALVRHNIRPHVQELLVYGSKTQQVTPGALKAALATLTAPPSMTREEAERLVDAFGAVCWDNGRVSHKEGYPAEYAAARAALLDALTRPAGTDGWVLVPRVPTMEMVNEGWSAANNDAMPAVNGVGFVMDTACVRIYTAMIAAAPKVPQVSSPVKFGAAFYDPRFDSWTVSAGVFDTLEKAEAYYWASLEVAGENGSLVKVELLAAAPKVPT